MLLAVKVFISGMHQYDQIINLFIIVLSTCCKIAMPKIEFAAYIYREA